MSKSRKDDLAWFSQVFGALSNPNRLRIFIRLISCCTPGTRCSSNDASACVGELGQDLEIALSTVSHHIKELCRAGLIRMERSGKRVECWIDPEAMHRLGAFLGKVRK